MSEFAYAVILALSALARRCLAAAPLRPSLWLSRTRVVNLPVASLALHASSTDARSGGAVPGDRLCEYERLCDRRGRRRHLHGDDLCSACVRSCARSGLQDAVDHSYHFHLCRDLRIVVLGGIWSVRTEPPYRRVDHDARRSRGADDCARGTRSSERRTASTACQDWTWTPPLRRRAFDDPASV